MTYPWLISSFSLGYTGHRPFGSHLLRPPQQPRPGHLSYNADAAIQQIHRWVGQCVKDHTTCENGGFAPGRFVQVSQNSRSEHTVRLVESWPAFSLPFIALSHCWGGTQHAVTTKGNYAQRKAGIFVGSLSRTFQDAIWIARRLGVAYLWIDSLCIIQDDPEDWDREAMNMYRLYGAAYLTLSASHGSDGDAGIFPRDEMGRTTALEVQLKASDGDITTVCVEVKAIPHLDKNSQVHKAYSTEDGAIGLNSHADVLQTRGWVLQERALSTRIVHFNSQELVWECRSGTSCQCGQLSGSSFMTRLMGSLRHRQDPEHKWEPEDAFREDDDDDDEFSENDYEQISDERQFWADFVKLFTDRALTKPQDRAPAFAGIAQTFHKFIAGPRGEDYFGTLGEFCAGLWQEHLPGALLWSCSTSNILKFPLRGSVTARRIPDARAPSWSWYSVNGPCTIFKPSGYDESSQLHFDNKSSEYGQTSFAYKSVTDSPFGRLERSHLSVPNAVILKAERSSPDEKFALLSEQGQSLGSNSCVIHFCPDDPEAEDYVGEVALLSLVDGSHSYGFGHPDDRPPSPDGVDEEAHEPDTDSADSSKDVREADWHGEDGYAFYSATCKDHNFGVVLVAAQEPPDDRQDLELHGFPKENGDIFYRRIGIYHMEGSTCIGTDTWEVFKKQPVSGYARDFVDSMRSENILLI
jgi:hypothetical protein